MKDGKTNEINDKDIDNIKNMPKRGKLNKKGSSKFKKIVILVLVGTGVIVGAVKLPTVIKNNCIVPEVSYTLKETIHANSNSICFDEVLESHSKLVEDMTLLENYLNASLKVSKLNLSKYRDVIVSDIESTDLLGSFEVYYQEYIELSETINSKVLSNDSLRLFELVSILKGYEEEINSKISTSNYDTVANYGILLLKSILLDSSNIDYDKIDNIKIAGADEEGKLTYSDPVSGQQFIVSISELSFTNTILKSIYSAQSNFKNINSNQEIRNELIKIINYYKVAQYMAFGNNGTLKNETNFGDVRNSLNEEIKLK